MAPFWAGKSEAKIPLDLSNQPGEKSMLFSSKEIIARRGIMSSNFIRNTFWLIEIFFSSQELQKNKYFQRGPMAATGKGRRNQGSVPPEGSKPAGRGWIDRICLYSAERNGGVNDRIWEEEGAPPEVRRDHSLFWP
jgi:hypothetical protein